MEYPKINEEILKNFSYEIIERITRFVIHLEEIEKQFYLDDTNAKDKLIFIDNYKESLFKILSISVLKLKNNDGFADLKGNSNHFEILRKSLVAINELHSKWLSILPRPSEPVELNRFKRVIYKQIVQLDKNKDEIKPEISISINEELGEEINLDPLGVFKEETINSLIRDYNLNCKVSIKELSKDVEKKEFQLHITIPRIDAANTYRWSSLIHEMAHSLMDDVVFDGNSIEDDFLKFIDNDRFIIDFFKPTGREDLDFSPNNLTLRHWLTECWCDLFACILIGPSFYFSQYLAFLNEPSHEFIKHPPASFRLYLIESIISGRFHGQLYELLESKYIGVCDDLILALQINSPLQIARDKDIGRVTNYFKQYFKKHFFSYENKILIEGNERLNAKLEVLVKKYVTVHPEIIKNLVYRLNQGLPIPSVKIENDINDFEEIPTYVQEIFLASWITRNDILKKDILERIGTIELNESNESIIAFYKDFIEMPIKRHDQAVLKSLQVSEWFDFFNKEKPRKETITVFKPVETTDLTLSLSGILVDQEIKKLILCDELKIIPLMNMQEQIGTTSLDIRLGTSFQLFSPDQYGMIDFTEISNDKSFATLSKRVNLDFIEGITIAPGQFLLGHSMEYIKLPDYISGNLEGRSSFARLGIEIHMTAGFIDPGFEGVITFEIFNAGANTVKLYPGMRIAQMRFEKNNIPKTTYEKQHTVKYKGLLEHNVSRQSRDSEVELIREARKKTGIFK